MLQLFLMDVAKRGAAALGAGVCPAHLCDEDSGFLQHDRVRTSGRGGEAQGGSAGEGPLSLGGGGPRRSAVGSGGSHPRLRSQAEGHLLQPALLHQRRKFQPRRGV